MTPRDVVIIGTGQAGFQVAASLREGGFEGRVRLLGDEPDLPYQRPPLSKGYLTGAVSRDQIGLRRAPFYQEQRIELLPGERAAAIDRAARQVELRSGQYLDYDHLVLATGARQRSFPGSGAELEGVLGLRTLADAEALRRRLEAARAIVVIGAGFIGLEVAATAAQRGLQVAVLEQGPRVMGRAVSIETGDIFAEAHRRAGIELHLGQVAQAILGEGGRVRAVATDAGAVLPADLVLVGIGVLPETELAAGAGLPCRDGILVDALLCTSDPMISAIGDCAAHPNRHAGQILRLESVQNAVDQARCVAARLLGRPAAYTAVPWFWSDQGALRLQIVGLTRDADQTVRRGDPSSERGSVFCFKAGRLIGIETINHPADHMAGRRLLAGEPGLTPTQAADLDFDLKAHSLTVASRSRPSAER